jgi:hypothetical protein
MPPLTKAQLAKIAMELGPNATDEEILKHAQEPAFRADSLMPAKEPDTYWGGFAKGLNDYATELGQGALEHMAHPQSLGDFLSLLLPSEIGMIPRAKGINLFDSEAPVAPGGDSPSLSAAAPPRRAVPESPATSADTHLETAGPSVPTASPASELRTARPRLPLGAPGADVSPTRYAELQDKFRGGDIQRLAREVVDLHNQDGGATYSPTHGNLAGSPRYALSVFPEREMVVEGDLTPAHVAKFALKNQDILSDPRAAIGSWKVSTPGSRYPAGSSVLDIAATTPDLGAARRLAKQAGQEAIWDLWHGQELPIGASTPGTLPPATVERLNALPQGMPDMLTLEHRSTQPGLTELDPERYGSGLAGAELKRAQAYPNDFVKRTYFTVAGQPVEGRFKQMPVYGAQFPKGRLYDLGLDPEKFAAQLSDAIGDPARYATLLEKMAKDAGYEGIINSKHENPALAGTVALFRKLGVK